MKCKWVTGVICWVMCMAGSVFAENMTITDMGGRMVSVPVSASKVFSRSPVGTIMMYSLNPTRIAGQNWQPTKNEKDYLSPVFLGLPVLSGWFGNGNIGNTEEIIKAAPDLILSAFYTKAKSGAIDQANRIQQQLNIPVVLVDLSLERMAESYRFVGGLIGESERAEVLAQYAEATLADTKRRAATIDPSARRSVYYAEGPNGLQTDPAGSRHARVIDWVGGVNVATVKMKSGMGRTMISPEQLLQWNPDLILACHDQGFAAESATADAIRHDGRLASLKALKNGQVYEVPFKPFNFIDRPPSINRLIGLKWLGHRVYPETFDYDMRAETAHFYELFYHIHLSKEQLNDILK